MKTVQTLLSRHRRPIAVVALALTMGLVLTLAVGAMPGYDSPDPAVIQGAIADGFDYVTTQQGENGGIDSFGFGIDMGGTTRAILALAATGQPVDTMVFTATGASLVDHLQDEVITYTHKSGSTDSAGLFPARGGLCLAASAAANLDGASVGGMDLIGQIEEAYIAASGTYSTSAVEGFTSGWASDMQQAWVIVGLAAAGQPVPEGATDWLIAQQAEDGTWAWGDPDTTALAVIALVGSTNVSPSHESVQRAIAYFRETQLPSGGWRPSWDGDPLNADTTAWVLQALTACGYVPATASWAGSPNPLDGLIALVKPDGRIGGTYANAYSTLEAILGMSPQPVFMLGNAQRAKRALTWLHWQQLEDGAYPGWAGADVGATCDAALAYVAAGYDPDTVMSTSGASALDYIEANAATYAETDPSTAGKAIVTLAAAGSDPTDVGGVDLVQTLNDTYWDDQVGAFGTITNTWHQAFGILALAAVGAEVPPAASQALIALQQTDGGWKYDLTDAVWNTTTPDNTALALQALMAAGEGRVSLAVQDAVAYLADAQSDEYGHWGNANSTSYAIMGLRAAGENLEASPYLSASGLSPLGALAAMQKVDGPFVSMWATPMDNLLTTSQSVQALLGLSLPRTSPPLDPWSDAALGPDPDRYVAVAPVVLGSGDSGYLALPYGSDLNGNATVDALYRSVGATEWRSDATVTPETGYYTIMLPNLGAGEIEYRLSIGDADGVQFGTAFAYDVVFEGTLPLPIYIPLIRKLS